MNPQDSALIALHSALVVVAPDLHVESSDGASWVSLKPGGPRMVIRVEYFMGVVEDPEALLDYARRIVDKLRKEESR